MHLLYKAVVRAKQKNKKNECLTAGERKCMRREGRKIFNQMMLTITFKDV